MVALGPRQIMCCRSSYAPFTCMHFGLLHHSSGHQSLRQLSRPCQPGRDWLCEGPPVRPQGARKVQAVRVLAVPCAQPSTPKQGSADKHTEVSGTENAVQ